MTTTNQTAKVAVAKIEILWSESSELADGASFETFGGIDLALRRAAFSAPDTGAYNKVGFKVTWQDGEEYEGRFDLQREHAKAPGSLIADQIRSFSEFSSGRSAPARYTAEEWKRTLTARGMDCAAFARLLDCYQIGDEQDPSSPLPEPPAAGPANDITATEEKDRARRVAAENARLVEVSKSHWTGEKYDANRPFAETAKLIRKDLAAAAKADCVLRGVKCRVRSGWSTHSRSLDIDILDVPLGMPIVNPARVEIEMTDPHTFTGRSWMSTRGKRIQEAIEAIVRTYNYDKSDTMTDYHDCGFYVSVSYASQVTEAHRDEVRRAVRLARGAA